MHIGVDVSVEYSCTMLKGLPLYVKLEGTEWRSKGHR